MYHLYCIPRIWLFRSVVESLQFCANQIILQFILNLITLWNFKLHRNPTKLTKYLTVFPYIHTIKVDRMEVNNLSAIFRVISFFPLSLVRCVFFFFSSFSCMLLLSCNSLYNLYLCLCVSFCVWWSIFPSVVPSFTFAQCSSAVWCSDAVSM